MVKEKGVVIGHLEVNMRPRRKMKIWLLAETKGMRVSIGPMIKTLEIREDEVEDMDKDQEEEASMVPISIAMRKFINSLNALNNKEG